MANWYIALCMVLPYFYTKELSEETIVLDEDTSKHITGVLRMKKGEELLLTNGKGVKAKAVITDDNRKRCTVKTIFIEKATAPITEVIIAISLLKNAARFEWFLEKATEIGVSEIIPLRCERTERENVRYERMNAILISAMLQSQQYWLPILHHPTTFENAATQTSAPNKFVAHCLESGKQALASLIPHRSSIILIGPEGDFTEKEINIALQNNFTPVTLGTTRLRTETAGIVAATLLCIR